MDFLFLSDQLVVCFIAHDQPFLTKFSERRIVSVTFNMYFLVKETASDKCRVSETDKKYFLAILNPSDKLSVSEILKTYFLKNEVASDKCRVSVRLRK